MQWLREAIDNLTPTDRVLMWLWALGVVLGVVLLVLSISARSSEPACTATRQPRSKDFSSNDGSTDSSVTPCK